MTKREMIEKLKRNTCVFGEMPKEEQEMLVEVGQENRIWMTREGWCKDGFREILDCYTYRIAMDYQPPEEAKIQADDLMMWKEGTAFIDGRYRRKAKDCSFWPHVGAKPYSLILAPPEPPAEKIMGYRVVDFRPPKKGEKFVAECVNGLQEPSNCTDEAVPPKSPRYILERVEEAKPASRWIECEVKQSDIRYYFDLNGTRFYLAQLPLHGFAGMRYADCETWFMSPVMFDYEGHAYASSHAEENNLYLEIDLYSRRIVSVRFQRDMVEGK